MPRIIAPATDIHSRIAALKRGGLSLIGLAHSHYLAAARLPTMFVQRGDSGPRFLVSQTNDKGSNDVHH